MKSDEHEHDDIYDGTDAQAELPPGWAFPACSRKAHYFPAGHTMSLCGKVGFFFSPDRETGNNDSADNCAECKKRFQKSLPKVNPSF